jgi:hypothetical protein
MSSASLRRRHVRALGGRGHAVGVGTASRRSAELLDRARRLASAEGGLAVVVTQRADGSAHASVVNAGVLDHPVTGASVIGFVVQGLSRTKVANLRREPRATVVFRSGWEWVTAEGRVDLLGPGDVACMPWPESKRVFHAVYVAAIGGTEGDWAASDTAIETEGHVAVLVHPDRVYGSSDQS